MEEKEKKEKKGFFSKLADLAFTTEEVPSASEDSVEKITDSSISTSTASVMASPVENFTIPQSGDGR